MEILRSSLRSIRPHHAYFIEDPDNKLIEELKILLVEEMNVKMLANPDVAIEEFQSFGIDEARKLKAFDLKKSLGQRKIFILKTQSFTIEAQNTLLKLFEEPQGEAVYFILAPSIEIVVPTLRSRFFLISNEQLVTEEGEDSEIEIFISANPKDRLDAISKIVEEKDKKKAIEFLNRIEKTIRKKNQEGLISTQEFLCLGDVIEMRGYLRDRSPSVKLIMEHIALTLPKF